MAVKNIAASVLAKLRNQAKQEGINYQIGLQLFIQEEFLRRLSKSAYKENLVLKGGMFIYTLTEFESRPTKDMDFLMQSISDRILLSQKDVGNNEALKLYPIYMLPFVLE